MNGHSLGAAVRRLRDALGGPAGSDAALLDRFAADRDPAAFAGLVARYGPVVLGVCRRIVGDPHLAEDVFQAVFLVLARKAGSIRKRDAVGSWLYGVAYRLARKARNRSRFAIEPRNANEPIDPAATAAWNDLLAALDTELQRLPDRLRAPLLLCYYDGCTQDEAARRLGWTFGTLRRRLDQARDLLRVRMTARGATLGAGLLATVLATRGARAAVPGILSRTTIDAAGTFAVGGPLAGAATQLAEEGLRMLGASKLRAGVALMAFVGGLAAGTGALLGVGRDQPVGKDRPPVAHAPNSPDALLPDGVVLRHGGLPFRHGAEIISVLVSPDGKSILTQAARSVRIWDAVSGQDQGVLELPEGGADFWTGSLTPDGKTLLTTRHNGTAQVWDIAARKMTRSFPIAAPPFDVTGAQCVHSPDGKEIGVVTADGSIRVCDVAAGKEMQQLRSHSDEATAAVFSPDSKWLLVASGRGKLLEFNVNQGFIDHTADVVKMENLCYSPDGKWVAAAHVDRNAQRRGGTTSVSVFEWPSPRNPSELRGNSLAQRLMAITPDSRYLLAPDSMSDGRILTQWDLGNSRAVRQYAAHDKPIRSLSFTADGKTLITADSGLRFWDWKKGTERRASTDDEHCYTLTADGKAVVQGSSTGAIRLWDSTTGKELHRFDVPRPAPELQTFVTNVAASPDGKYLAAQGWVAKDKMSAGEGWYVWLWDLAAETFLHRLNDRRPTQAAGNAIAFSHDGHRLISATGNGVLIWDTAAGSEIKDWTVGGQGAERAVFSANDDRLIVWGGKWRVRMQDPIEAFAASDFVIAGGRTGGRTGNLPITVVFSSDGSRLAVSALGDDRGEAGEVRIYDTATHATVRRLQNRSRPPKRLALSTTGAMLAVASDNENPTIQVFDVATGHELKTFTGLRGQSAWLDFAPDGKRLYAASTDTTVLAWEMK